jgi:hypothetical protein
VLGGVLIAVEQTGALFTDYHRAYVEPAVHFSYPLFPWLAPWPPAGVYAHFLFNSAAALAVAVGWRYRASAWALTVGLTSLFLMERGVYINHAYLYCLYAGLLAVVPAHRALSLDVRAGRVTPASSAPAWALWLLRFQIAVVYVFAGIANLDPDWRAAMPVKLWLADRAGYPLIGGALRHPMLAYAIAWGGIALDLLVVPGLLWRRTRLLALTAAIFFHVTNAIIFGIGTFPWFSIVATALFLPPATFRRAPVLSTRLPATDEPGRAAPRRPASAGVAVADSTAMRPAAAVALAAYVVIQLLVPLRALAYPGRSVWTEEGATFAWRMMLRDKRGTAYFVVRNPAKGTTRRVSVGQYVTPWQLRTLVGTPDMLLQLAHWLARREASGAQPTTRGARHARPRVRAITSVRLNGRSPQPLVDPRVDLAHERRRLGHYPWIMPLEDAQRAHAGD